MPTTVAAEDHATRIDTGLQGTSPEPESPLPHTPSPGAEGDTEEGRDSYRPGGFNPVYIGDIYAEKYKVLSKIDYGVCSTVWLIRDLTKQ